MLKVLKSRPKRISSFPTIGIDLLASSSDPIDLMESALTLSQKHPDMHFMFLAGEEEEKRFQPLKTSTSSFFRVEDIIYMDEDPITAIRRKKNSSLYQGIHLLRDLKIDAFVTAGNTGALVTAAKMLLPSMPSIQRPALLALIPTKKKLLAVVDIGANVTKREKLLLQCAYLGVALQKTRGIPLPKVGLLNIGEEAKKGTSELKKAYLALKKVSDRKKPPFSFFGNIEAKHVYDGNIDVLVTDGFTGNIFLKTSEGMASLIIDRLKENVSKEEYNHLTPLLSDLEKKLHYAQYPGAILCGVDRPIIKCHGYSTPAAFSRGIEGAIELLKNGSVPQMRKEILKALSLGRYPFFS